jgi:uncharacterized protein (TIGR03083 family)
MPDLAAAYADTHASMVKLTADLDDAALAAIVPACPAWSVKDLIAHVTSVAAALATGSFPPDLNPATFWDPDTAVRREAFVEEGLAMRRNRSIGKLLDEWETAAGQLEAMMRGERPWPEEAPPLPEWIVVTDLAVHHHDLRGAIGAPGERDSLATGLSLRSYVEGMRFASAVAKRPTFRIEAGERGWTIGDGEPVATVTADPFELARAASGRRNPDQIRAFGWRGDPEPFIECFYPYGLRTDALVE